MALTEDEIRASLEAIIFVSGEPVKIEDLYGALSDESRETVDTHLALLVEQYRERNGGIFLEQTAGGYRFATRADLDAQLRRFFSKQNEGRLSLAALETLAIIAYKQPITAPEIADIRGVNSSGVLRTLLDRKMIRIAGRKNVVGSPFLYRTTKDFLVHFGLNDIQDLPRLEEFAEVLGENLNEELLGSGPTSEYLRGEDEPAEGGESTAVQESMPDEPLQQSEDVEGDGASTVESATSETSDDVPKT